MLSVKSALIGPHPHRPEGGQPAEGDGPIEDVCGRGGGLSVLCLAGCGSTRLATSSSEELRTTELRSTETRDSVTIELRDTLKEVTTITIDRNDVGDTLKVVLATIRQHGTEVKFNVENGTLNGTLNDILKRLNPTQEKVYGYIKANPGIQAKHIIADLKMQRDTLNNVLRTLTDLHLIEHRDSKKTGGYYPL